MEHFLNMDYEEKGAKSMKSCYLFFFIAELTCFMFSLLQFMVLKYNLGR